MTEAQKPEGVFMVVTGASCAGKTTAVEAMIADSVRYAGFATARLVTMTTRQPRPGEVNGVDYHFVSRDEFMRCVEEKKLLENEANYGPNNLYGSPLDGLLHLRATVDVAVAILDPKGARTVKDRFKDDVTVVMLTASMADLEERMQHRFGDADNLAKRLAMAQEDERVSRMVADFVISSSVGGAGATAHRLIELATSRLALRDARTPVQGGQ